jgi:hypothetical protein
MNIKKLLTGFAVAMIFGVLLAGSMTAGASFIDGFSYQRTTDELGIIITKYTVTVDANTATDITIPAFIEGLPVVEIGTNAFYDPSNAHISKFITRITMPNTVTKIGTWAFRGCERLTTIELSTALTEIGNGAFQNCFQLQAIVLPEGLKKIGNNAFQDCRRLGAIVIPDSVTELGNGAFIGCSIIESGVTLGLESVTIGTGLTSIEPNTFQNCRALKTVTFKGPSKVETIGANAFQNNVSLNHIEFPFSLTEIGNNAFQGCSVTTTTGNITTGLPGFSFPQGSQLTSIGNLAFQNSRALEKIIIPDSVTSVGVGAFENTSTTTGAITGLTEVTIGAGLTNLSRDMFKNSRALKTVTFAGGGVQLHTIGPGAFADCKALESFTIPPNVTSIAHGSVSWFGAFEGSGLKSIEIPNKVTLIGLRAFRNCLDLSNVIFAPESSVNLIGAGAFRGCTSLKGITIPYSVTEIGSSGIATNDNAGNVNIGGVFAHSGLVSIVIPDNIIFVHTHSFEGCKDLASVSIGTGLNFLWTSVFVGCTKLETITIPNNITGIVGYTFRGSGLKEVIFAPGSKLTTIGDSVFRDCPNLFRIALPDSVTSLGNYVFTDSVNLTFVELPDTIESMGNNIFQNCRLTSIKIPSSMKSIGALAFSGSGLINVTIHSDKGGFTGVNQNVFSNCPNLTTVTFTQPEPPTLGSNFFLNSPKLSTIYVPLNKSAPGTVRTAYLAELARTNQPVPSGMQVVEIDMGDGIFICSDCGEHPCACPCGVCGLRKYECVLCSTCGLHTGQFPGHPSCSGHVACTTCGQLPCVCACPVCGQKECGLCDLCKQNECICICMKISVSGDFLGTASFLPGAIIIFKDEPPIPILASNKDLIEENLNLVITKKTPTPEQITSFFSALQKFLAGS